MQTEIINAYTEALERWFKAQKDHPGIYAGEKPLARDFGFKTVLDIWQANEIENRVRREMGRSI